MGVYFMDLSGLNWIKRYVLAVFIVILTLVVALAINTIFPVPAFTLFLGAVAVNSWIGGFGPGKVFPFLTAFLLHYFFFPPFYLVYFSQKENTTLFLFSLVCFLICWLTEMQRRGGD